MNMKLTDGRTKKELLVHYNDTIRYIPVPGGDQVTSQGVGGPTWIQTVTFVLVRSKRTLLKFSSCTTSSTRRSYDLTSDKDTSMIRTSKKQTRHTKTTEGLR